MKKERKKNSTFKLCVLSALSGVLSGLAATLFLTLLDLATNMRNAHREIIWALPIAGFFIGWAYHQFGKDIAAGNNLILERIHDPRKKIPLMMTPFILIGTVITHLFGGSAGREGTAVQMGASLSDQLSHFFKVSSAERKVLLVTGAGSGFGAAIGAPWAGVIFGMEVIQIGKLKPFAMIECVIASFCAYYTSLLLHAPHSVYPSPTIDSWNFKTLFWTAVAGIIFGLVANSFSRFTHWIEKIERRFISYAPFKPLIAGLILVLLYAWEGSYRYVGLGIPVIQESLEKVTSFYDPVFKFLFTSITVASGFKGGEFIPLVFIGATLGSALSVILPVASTLLAAVGFAAVFGAASNTPLACTVMAVEIFGLKIAPYALVACYISYYFSGHRGIYHSQPIKNHKHTPILSLLSLLGELPKRFFS